MKKILTPVLLALLGLGAGVGAGLAMKPEPEPEIATVCAGPAAEGGAEATGGADAGAEGDAAGGAEAAAPCPPGEADPFAPPAKAEEKGGEGSELAYVTMDKPFVVPVFKGDKVVAMVVLSLSVETDTESAPAVEGVKPRLRDSFLQAMFRHANSGGFDGSFTTGTKMDDLKSALLQAAKSILPGAPPGEVLITEIARQDV